jgi:hypothetical protein
MTATMESVDLDRAVESLERKLEDKMQEIVEWEGKKKNIEQELSAVRADHASACEALALDRGSSKAVSSLAGEIADLEDRLLGTTRILALRRTQHVELRNQIVPLQTQQTELAQKRAIAEEANAVQTLIMETERNLADTTASAQKFGAGIVALRTRTFIADSNRHAAADAAQSLERRANGMRP